MRAPDLLARAFRQQSRACAGLDSPFMARLMNLFATRDWPDTPLTQRIFNWTGDISPAGQSVPLRLAGALHALHLQGDPVLGPVYPPHDATDDLLWQAVTRVMQDSTAAIDAFMDQAPQTNEVRRAAGLIAIGHWLADRFGLPIRTSELGASAGLNLHWDSYALDIGDARFGPDDPALRLTPDWTGPLPPAAPPVIASRAGVDIHPLSPQKDALRLQAYLWPDQPERLTRTRAAIAATHTPVDQGDAVDWLNSRLAHHPGQLHLIYSTVAWQYFPADKKALGTKLIAQAGASATAQSPLAWWQIEADGQKPGAALTLRLWPGNLTLHFGRFDFHGRWVDWQPPEIPL